MKQVKTYSELFKGLLDILYDVVIEVGDKINDKLRYHIDEEVYINQNNYYANGTGQPTYELRESVTTSEPKKTGNSVSVKIFHDKNKMSFAPDDFIHGSRYWKDGLTDIRELLPLIIDQGLSGNLFGEGWWTEPRPYFSNTLEELKNNGLLKKWFREALVKRGLKVQ